MTNTNKKAIEILKKNRPSWVTRECDKELCWAVDTAIDVLNAFENLGDFVTKFADSYDYALVAKDVWRDAKKALEKQMQEPKTGHWVLGGYDDNYYICDRCNYKASEYYFKPHYTYCPNCGAKMEGSDADNN